MRPMPKVTVLLEEAQFRRLDAYCRKGGFKKSTLIARLIRDHLDAEAFQLQGELPLNTPSSPAPMRHDHSQ